jgi:hypothetical protein
VDAFVIAYRTAISGRHRQGRVHPGEFEADNAYFKVTGNHFHVTDYIINANGTGDGQGRLHARARLSPMSG